MSASAAKRHLWESQRDHVSAAARPSRNERPGVTSDGEVHSEARARAILRPWALPDGSEAKAARTVERAGDAGGWPAGEVDRVLEVPGIGGAP